MRISIGDIRRVVREAVYDFSYPPIGLAKEGKSFPVTLTAVQQAALVKVSDESSWTNEDGVPNFWVQGQLYRIAPSGQPTAF